MSTPKPMVDYVEALMAAFRADAATVVGRADSETYMQLGRNLADYEDLLGRAEELSNQVEAVHQRALQVILDERTRQGVMTSVPAGPAEVPAKTTGRQPRMSGTDPYEGLTLLDVLQVTGIPKELEPNLSIRHLLRAVHWVSDSSGFVWVFALRNILRGMSQTKLAKQLGVRQGDALSGIRGHVKRICREFLGFAEGQTIPVDHPYRKWFLGALMLQSDRDVWTAVFDILAYMPLTDATWDPRTIPTLNDVVGTYPSADALRVLDYRASHSGPSRPSPEHTERVCAELGMTEPQMQEIHKVLDDIAAGVMLHVMDLVPGTYTFPSVAGPFWVEFVNSPLALGMLNFWGPFGQVLSCMNSASGAVGIALNPLQPMPQREAQGCVVNEAHLVIHAEPTR